VRFFAGDLLPFGGGYKLIERIGADEFGEVWRAEAPDGVPMAVKIVSRNFQSQQAEEMLERLKSLHHPSLLHVYDYDWAEGQLCIITVLTDGNLRNRLEECRRNGLTEIPKDELFGYISEVAEAVDFLHSHDIIHRNIKPATILLLRRRAKLANFDLARLQSEQSSLPTESSGTPTYMAPEIWMGKLNKHCDQYALGFTYAELRLGRLVFGSRMLPEMMNDHLNKAPDLKPLPELEKQVILRAMSKDPAKRFPSCRAFIEALAETTSSS
jgi:serine/threonine protein kinase